MDRDLVIATSGRTGSNYLARLIAKNGLPVAFEYFHPNLYGFDQAIRDGVSAQAFLAKCREGVDPALGLGIKLMASHVIDFTPHVVPPLTDAALALQSLFGGAKFIHLERRDKSLQSVSLWRAGETGEWAKWTSDPTPKKLPTTEPKLEELVRGLEYIYWSHDFWRGCFHGLGIKTFEVIYEDFCETPEKILREIFDFLEVPQPAELTLDPGSLVQRDEISDRHARKFDVHVEAMDAERARQAALEAERRARAEAEAAAAAAKAAQAAAVTTAAVAESRATEARAAEARAAEAREKAQAAQPPVTVVRGMEESRPQPAA